MKTPISDWLLSTEVKTPNEVAFRDYEAPQLAQLEQLKRIADALEAKSLPWISASDKLPPRHQAVLVSGGVAMHDGDHWLSGMEEPLYKRRIEWAVTKWMPLPE